MAPKNMRVEALVRLDVAREERAYCDHRALGSADAHHVRRDAQRRVRHVRHDAIVQVLNSLLLSQVTSHEACKAKVKTNATV